MSKIVEAKFEIATKKGRRLRHPVTLEFKDGRIYFLKSPFGLKDEIKAMKGSKWHGYDEEDGRKIWSIEDCQRNQFQIGYLMGQDVYSWFDRELIHHDFGQLYCNCVPKDLMIQQQDMADNGLTYHYHIFGAEMGVGKTLSAQLVIQCGGVTTWWWIGPKSSLANMRREFRMWGFDFDGPIKVEFMSYEALVRRMDEWKPGDPIPQGMVADECSRVKGDGSQRTGAAKLLAEKIRDKYGFEGYVIEMSGTPSPKRPTDWWAPCEIAWPGFLKEGSPGALEKRLAFMRKEEYSNGAFFKRFSWKDDERKCNVCGDFYENGSHDSKNCDDLDAYHKFEPSVNEVALMYERLKGLVTIWLKKDCLNLPDKRYRKIICKPSSSVIRVAKAIKDSAENTVTGMMLLRELSDGFQYREVKSGTAKCRHCESGKVFEWVHRHGDRRYRNIEVLSPELVEQLDRVEVDCPQCKGTGQMDTYTRETREIPCPKDKALKYLMDECEESGRIVIFAGFTGSVDRATKLCQKQGWSVVRLDGRGYQVTTKDNELVTTVDDDALEFWNDDANSRVAFVTHPESGGMSLTLTKARMSVYWSNSFKPEYRSQSEDRIHRKGMDENLGCTIVDLIHLPTDQRVIDVIRENRKLELMTMGQLCDVLDEAQTSEDEELLEELVA